MIKVTNISKSFDNKEVLKNISVEFEEGKINLIIGQSGSGKTILLKSLVGLVKVDQGEININNQVFNKIDIKQQREIRKNMGMVFQGSALFDYMTVEQNVMFPLDMYTNLTYKEKKEHVNNSLSRVNIENSNHLYPSQLSGGMQKRVAIARAIVLRPHYLFFDEPTSGLDPKTAIVIDDLIKEITEEYHTTTIINTHDMNAVMEIGEKIIFIHEGRKGWEGNKNDLFYSNNEYLNDFVFASKMAQCVRADINR